MSETWLQPDVLDRVLIFPGFSILRHDRDVARSTAAKQTRPRGGGVAILIADSLRAVKLDIRGADPTVESLWLSVSGPGRRTVVVGAIYRPPGGPTSRCLGNIRNQLQAAVARGKPVFALGDYNINLLNPDGPGVRGFKTILSDLNLEQLINNPTHLHPTPTLLDLVVTNVTGLRDSARVLPEPVADHQPVLICAPVPRERRRPTTTTLRPWRRVNWDALNLSLLLADWESLYTTDIIDDKLDAFMTVWNAAVDTHCPTTTVTSRRPDCPWLRGDAELTAAMEERDCARMTWEHCRTPESRRAYQQCRNRVKGLITLARRSYLCSGLLSGRRDFWSRIKQFALKPARGRTTSDDDDLSDRADNLNAHFAAVGPRIAEEAAAMRAGAGTTPVGPRPHRVCASALSLCPATLPELSTAIGKLSASRAVGIDGVSLLAVKRCFPVIGCHLLHLINRSIMSCTFPSAWKVARVTPVFKSGDRTDLNNFRPISILSVLSKIAEKVVCSQLSSYLLDNHVLTPSQYAYRPCHSTEDALIDTVEWLQRAVDNGHVTSITTIDLSKAFDSVDHGVLLNKLEWYGVSSKWFKNYLSGRRQTVSGGSVTLPLSHGVAQGSLVGPILFLIFINDLSNFLPHGRLLSYADDTQLLDSATPNAVGLSNLKARVEESIHCLQNWFQSNSLKMNPNKTDFMLAGTKPSLKKVNSFHITTSGTDIYPSSSVKVLGVLLDQHLTWEPHISSVVRRCNAILVSLFKIRHHFTPELLKLLVQAHVFPHILYCLSIWGGAAECHLGRVQRVVNFAARLVSGTRRSDHITPALKALGWQRVAELVHRRDCLNVYRALHVSNSPHALRALFVTRAESSQRQTRAVLDGVGALHLPRVRLTATQRQFPYRAAAAWNRLPAAAVHAHSRRSFLAVLDLEVLDQVQNTHHVDAPNT